MTVHGSPEHVPRLVAEAWAAVLGQPADDVDADFFTVGGDSVTALLLTERLNQLFSCELPIETLFTHATIRELVQLLEAGPTTHR
jgi:glutamate racemase